MKHVVYNGETGEILAILTSKRTDIASVLKGEFAGMSILSDVGDVDDLTQYVSNNSIVDKPAMNITVEEGDTCLISGLPIPCKVTVDGVDYIVDDGEIDIDFDLLKSHSIELESFPYISKDIEVFG